MKRILITGKNSYIGTSFENWVADSPEEYQVDSVGTKNREWKEKDFSQYDVVFHVAGIAHIKETKRNENLYYQINRDLAYEIAKKAKKEGVVHFIFLSSMSVYGMESGAITKQTKPSPTTAYGKSKLEAEKIIRDLEDESFTLSILRPPMVYGKECKGNYPRLAKLVVKIPIFPDINNKRSMIYIDNLSEFLKIIINKCSAGIYFPQNKGYVNVTELALLINKYNNNKVLVTRLFNPLITLLTNNIVKKVFGDLYYEKSISQLDEDYSIFSLEESIKITEGG